MTIPPAAVIALRDLIAKWRAEARDADAHTQADLQQCADDLDALVARVEPEQENQHGSMQTVRWVGRDLPEGSSGDVSAMPRDRQGRSEVARVEPPEGHLNEFAGLPFKHQGFAGLPERFLTKTSPSDHPPEPSGPQLAAARVEPQDQSAPAVHHICRLGNTGAWCRLDREWHDGAAKQFDYTCSDCGERITVNVSQWRKQEPATARVEPPPQEHGWQPIETAPKDGTEIIALVSGRPYFVSWTTHGTQHAEPWWRDREGYGLTEPTHWIPLPVLAAPPSPPPQEPT